jgi:chorismate mutase
MPNLLRSLLFIAIAFPGCSSPSTTREQTRLDSAKVDRLLETVRRRLVLAHDVARIKWNQKAPISDRPREKLILDRVVELGLNKRLDPAQTRRFFEAQIEASKMLQSADFESWRERGVQSFADVVDLKTLRLQIDEINLEMVDALAEIGPVPGELATRELISRRGEVILQGEGITNDVRRRAIGPLIEVNEPAAVQ